MLRRNIFKFFAAASLLSLSSMLAAQAPAFTPVNPPQPGGSNGQIEVIEFFSYGCSHCNNFDPILTKWRKEQKSDVVFRKIPVSFGNPGWAALGRMYLTLNVMGLSDKLDSMVFSAIHSDRVKLEEENTRNAWLTKQGVDVRKFNDTWRSFSVDSMARRSEQIVAAYKVMGVPLLAVNGRYQVEGEGGEGLKTVDKLIEKMRTPAPKPAPAAQSSKQPTAVSPSTTKPAKK